MLLESCHSSPARPMEVIILNHCHFFPPQISCVLADDDIMLTIKPGQVMGMFKNALLYNNLIPRSSSQFVCFCFVLF